MTSKAIVAGPNYSAEIGGKWKRENGNWEEARRYKMAARRSPLATRHLFFCALVFVLAEEGLEGVGAGEIVEQALPLFGIHRGGEEFGALFAELLEPGFVFGAELLLEFFAEALGERGALAGSGDGDLQRAAMRHGGVVEVAKLRNVYDVAEHAAGLCLGLYALVQLVRRRGGDNEQHSV